MTQPLSGGFLTCTGTDTGSGTTQTPKITMTLVDAGTGVATNNLTSGKPLTVRALLVSAKAGAAGQPGGHLHHQFVSCRV
jgi:hypothetical protein